MDEERRNGSNWDDKTIPLEEEQTVPLRENIVFSNQVRKPKLKHTRSSNERSSYNQSQGNRPPYGQSQDSQSWVDPHSRNPYQQGGQNPYSGNNNPYQQSNQNPYGRQPYPPMGQIPIASRAIKILIIINRTHKGISMPMVHSHIHKGIPMSMDSSQIYRESQFHMISRLIYRLQ